MHAFYDFMSLILEYVFSERLYEMARKKTYELLAYSFEHEINGSKVNDLAELLVCLAKEKYNERFKK